MKAGALYWYDISNRNILAEAAAKAWPDLPSSGFISGRVATKEDVFSGIAVFDFEHIKDQERAPLDIEIPQYAIRLSKIAGEAHFPVIIIQAETLGNTEFVGYRSIPDGKQGSALLNEFILLGKNKSSQ